MPYLIACMFNSVTVARITIFSGQSGDRTESSAELFHRHHRELCELQANASSAFAELSLG